MYWQNKHDFFYYIGKYKTERHGEEIIRKLFIILFAAIVLSGCSKYPEEPEKGKKAQILRPSTSPVVTIGPADATIRSIILLKADKSILSGAEIFWYVNNLKVESAKGTKFTSDRLRKSDIVQALILKGENEFYSNEIVIRNTPPTIFRAKILPRMPRGGSTLEVEATAEDIDGDKIFFVYKWYVDDKLIGEGRTLQPQLQRGDRITVKVTPYDAEESGKSVTLKTRVFNSPPVISESTPAFNGKVYEFRIMAADPDGDTLTYTLKQGPDRMMISPLGGVITWKVSPEDKGDHDVVVSISDNYGAEFIVPYTVTIGFVEE